MAIDHIGEAELDFVRHSAAIMHRRFYGLIDYEEFVAEGNLALVESATSYVDGKGPNLQAYAFKSVRGAMFTYAGKELKRPRLYLDDEAATLEVNRLTDESRSPLDHAILNDLCEKVERITAEIPIHPHTMKATGARERARKMPLAIKLYMQGDMERTEAAHLLGFKEKQGLIKMVKRGLEYTRQQLGLSPDTIRLHRTIV